MEMMGQLPEIRQAKRLRRNRGPDAFRRVARVSDGDHADELFEAYTQKHLVNLQRQNSGYTVKDENDNRHI